MTATIRDPRVYTADEVQKLARRGATSPVLFTLAEIRVLALYWLSLQGKDASQ